MARMKGAPGEAGGRREEGAVCTELENTAAMQRRLQSSDRAMAAWFHESHVDPHGRYKFTTIHTVVTSAQAVCTLGGLPWACSSSLLSSSECGWLLPLVTFLALLLDRTPAPERSITEGMTARHTHSRTHTENDPQCAETMRNINVYVKIRFKSDATILCI